MHLTANMCPAAAAAAAAAVLAAAPTLLPAMATGQHWSHVHPPQPAALFLLAAAATPTCSAHRATRATYVGYASQGINWSSRSHAGNACPKQLRLRCMCCLCA
jgi:hypothetical protein